MSKYQSFTTLTITSPHFMIRGGKPSSLQKIREEFPVWMRRNPPEICRQQSGVEFTFSSQLSQSNMKDEIAAAVVFLARLINVRGDYTQEKMNEFSNILAEFLVEKFRNHWYVDRPSRGQAFRCIRIATEEPRDGVLIRASKKSGLEYERFNLPVDFTLWVDPLEVVCRFGENGTICPIASFSSSTSSTSQGNDNDYATSQSSDDNGNIEVNANQRTVIDCITDVLRKNAESVQNTNSTVITTQRKGRKHRAKYNLVRNAINVQPESDWPTLPQSQYRWVNQTLAAKA